MSESAAAAEDRRYFLELGLVALTTVENVLGERTPEANESIELLKGQYTSEQLAEGAMIVLTNLIANVEDSGGPSVPQQVRALRELLIATLDGD